MSVRSYSNDRIEIRFDGKKCIHSRKCVLRLPQVFRAGMGADWIDADGASVDEITSIARACPSGAITYVRKDGEPGEAVPKVNSAALWENGPLELRADLRLGDATATRAVLCRCGLSTNKPYCDGSHRQGFAATGELPAEKDEKLADRGGPLTVTPTKNGPLHVEGNLEIVSGSGGRIARKTDAWLCRCGQSANKPYCDGSHRKAGFTADGSE